MEEITDVFIVVVDNNLKTGHSNLQNAEKSASFFGYSKNIKILHVVDSMHYNGRNKPLEKIDYSYATSLFWKG